MSVDIEAVLEARAAEESKMIAEMAVMIEEVQREVLKLQADKAELLTALESLLFIAENADETGYVTDYGFINIEAEQAKARAIIAKAKGAE